MEILDVIKSLRDVPHCSVHAPTGLPMIRPEHVLPDDLRAFYEACGGFTWNFYVGSVFWDSFSVLPPGRVVLANPLVCCMPEEEFRKLDGADDISWDWYAIAVDGNGDYFSIDLSPIRLGRCYDSGHETHAQVGDTPHSWFLIY